MSGGGASYDRLGSAAADGAGGVVVAGTFSENATFGRALPPYCPPRRVGKRIVNPRLMS
jgi:hypothetical protein